MGSMSLNRLRLDLHHVGMKGAKNFRLHDNRHDTATKMLRQTKNLRIVQHET
jgi:hypothetical protein